jgi:hypothetical protein
LGKSWGGFDEVELKRGGEVGMVLQEEGEDIVGEVTAVGPLLDNMKRGWMVEKLGEF